MPSLFDPITVGDLVLPNRIVMSPLTRSRADEGFVPNDLMVEYYSQRASAGLIITEATPVDPQGVGYARTGAIWNDAQVAGWKRVTDSVHAKGGRIVMQLWHVGRISDPSFHDGALPVGPSALAPQGHVSLLRPQRPYVVPRALTTAEVRDVVEQFRRGAQLAQKAGFDGVELHGANGYLLDQFLQDSTNRRDDEYGGSLENRARLMLEATDAAISVWGAGRVGMHLAPRADTHTMGDSNLPRTFGYVAEQLGKRGIAFICAREHAGDDALGPMLKKRFGGVYIVNEGYTKATAQAALDAGQADAVAFGKLFIANPDLVERLRTDAPLNPPDNTTFYAGGAKGYVDYPTLDQVAA